MWDLKGRKTTPLQRPSKRLFLSWKNCKDPKKNSHIRTQISQKNHPIKTNDKAQFLKTIKFEGCEVREQGQKFHGTRSESINKISVAVELMELGLQYVQHPRTLPDLVSLNYTCSPIWKKLVTGKKFYLNETVVLETHCYFEPLDESYCSK